MKTKGIKTKRNFHLREKYWKVTLTECGNRGPVGEGLEPHGF